MNLGELIEAYRDEAQDQATPPFCTDERLTRFANEGQIEACRRGMLITDSTSAMCTVEYAAGDVAITLDQRILEVRAASIGREDLRLRTAGHLVTISPNWRNETVRATPQFLVQGVDTGKLLLYPRPATSGTINLTVYRLPLVGMREGVDSDKPEIRPEWHQGLVDWMLYRAYSRRDGDQLDPTLAAEALQRFEAEFGKRHGARNEEWSRSAPMSSPPPIA